MLQSKQNPENADTAPKDNIGSRIGFFSSRNSFILTSLIFVLVLAIHVCLIFAGKKPSGNGGNSMRAVTLRLSSVSEPASARQKIRTPSAEEKSAPLNAAHSPVKEYVQEEKPAEEPLQTDVLSEEESEPETETETETDIDQSDSENLTADGANATGITGDSSDFGQAGVQNVEFMIISRIQENKLYPLAARKRGLEGDVRLSFTVNTDGSVSNIQVLSENVSSVLCEAAKKSVRNSFPVDFSIDSPFAMIVTLRYELTG